MTRRRFSLILTAILIASLAPIILPRIGSGESGPKKWAVIIGVGKYQDARIPALRFAAADARALYKVLTHRQYGAFPKSNVKLLIDGDATVRSIKGAIGTWLKRKAGKDDLVVVYFAGHGAPEGEKTYWVTNDASIDDLYSTALSNDEVVDMLSRVPSKKIVTFLDSCYSAATVRRSSGTRDLIVEDVFAGYKGRGKVIITASDGRQKSMELDEYGHGIFTYYLVQALKGKADSNIDGVVLVREVWDFVFQRVEEDARSHGGNQTPTFKADEYSGQIVLAHNPSGNEEMRMQQEIEARQQEIEAQRRKIENQNRTIARKKKLLAQKVQLKAQEVEMARLKKKQDEELRLLQQEEQALQQGILLSKVSGAKKAKSSSGGTVYRITPEQLARALGTSPAPPAPTPTPAAAPQATANEAPATGFMASLAKHATSSGVRTGGSERPAPVVASTAVVTAGMIMIPAGEFTMGGGNRESSDHAHSVYLSAFSIGKFEVTNREYMRCVRAGKCKQHVPIDPAPTLPATGVSWNDAVTFCRWAGKRLPTEAEWEKAARGTDGRMYPFRGLPNCHRANYGPCEKGGPTPVGTFMQGASPYGVMDLAGNVTEWVGDWFEKYYYKSSKKKNPTGPPRGAFKVQRGGSYSSGQDKIRATFRGQAMPALRGRLFGFRCAKDG
jgi:formylglycine-generating enzyme required for sulfatase activity